MKEIIDVTGLAKGGPYSHANLTENLIFVSGQTGQIAGKETTFSQQFENAMKKIESILRSSGSSLGNVVKASIYMKRKDDFKIMNDLFGKYFAKNPPTRTTLIVSFVADDILVEIDVIASK